MVVEMVGVPVTLEMWRVPTDPAPGPTRLHSAPQQKTSDTGGFYFPLM